MYTGNVDLLENEEKVELLKRGLLNVSGFEKLIISAERTEQGKVLLHISDLNKEILTTWYYPPRKEDAPHRGNKQSYSMLMNKAFKVLLKEHKPSNEEIGVMTKLFFYADWGTGLLTKRKKPMKFEDMVDIIGNSDKTVKKIIKSLKDKKILDYKDNGYYLSRTFIKRGGAK